MRQHRSAGELEILLGRLAPKARALPGGGNQSDATRGHENTEAALISARIIATGRVGADAAKRACSNAAGCLMQGVLQGLLRPWFSPPLRPPPGPASASWPARPTPSRSRASPRRAAARDRLRLGARGAASPGRDRVVRAEPPRCAAARLGDAALRQFLAAPRSRVGAPRDALPDHDQRLRRRARSGDHRLAAHRTAVVPRRLHASSSSRAPACDAMRLRAQFAIAGYSHVTQVVAPGEYCIRGGLVDLFPMGSALPYRIDLVDDEIESIRTFDVDTQRTVYKVKEVRLLPAREFPLDDAARTRFRARLPRDVRGRSVEVAGLQGRSQRRRARRDRVLPAALLRGHRARSSTTCRRMQRSSCITTCTPRSRSSGATRRRATTCCRATGRARCSRPGICSSPPRSSSSPRARSSGSTCTRRSSPATMPTGSPPRRFPPWRSSAALPIRCRR